MLAGLGEDQAVIALAEDDPNPAVRGTACVALVRVAARDTRYVDRVLARLADDPSLEVRCRIIEGASSGVDARLTNALLTYASHPDRGLRAAVLARLEAGHDVQLGLVEERARVEPEQDLAHRWARLFAALAPHLAVKKLPASVLARLLSEHLDDGGTIPLPLLEAAVSTLAPEPLLGSRPVSTILERQKDELSRAVLLGLLAWCPELADDRWDALMNVCTGVPLEPGERAALEAVTSAFRVRENIEHRDSEWLLDAPHDADDGWEEPPSEEWLVMRQAELDQRRPFLEALEALARGEG